MENMNTNLSFDFPAGLDTDRAAETTTFERGHDDEAFGRKFRYSAIGVS